MANTDSELTRPFPDRRHDLDALRAGAMLLGIGLHAALSYVTFPFWPVYDESNHGFFDVVFSAIHGFRMPLFFMISGFFTAMLWRKRGIRSLAKQRAIRILVPLLVFLVPVNLFILAVIAGHTSLEESRKHSQPEKNNIWAAAKNNDVAALRKHLAAQADINQPDPRFQIPALNWAALNGSTDAARLLIKAGADVNGTSNDRSTPLSHAAFGAHPETVALLLENGADPNSVNQYQSTPLDNVRADQETLDWVARMLGLTVIKDSIQERRRETAELLRNAGGKRKNQLASPEANPDAPFLDRVSAAYLSLAEWRGFHEPQLFGHLWFLWFLCILIIPFLAYALIADLLSWNGPPRWLFLTPLALLWIVPLTLIPQWFHGLQIPTFGPDTSPTLFPLPHIVILYAVFFFFGALYFDCDDKHGRLSRGWWLMLPIALFIVYPLGMAFTYEPGADWIAGTIPQPLVRPLAVLMQALYAWLMIVGLIGLFRKICRQENKIIRYLSDAAYWLYIAHLPLIFLCQALVKPLNLHAFVKFTLVSLAVTALLLLVYDRVVRYTWLGTLLNGKRTRSSPNPPPLRASQ